MPLPLSKRPAWLLSWELSGQCRVEVLLGEHARATRRQPGFGERIEQRRFRRVLAVKRRHRPLPVTLTSAADSRSLPRSISWDRRCVVIPVARRTSRAR